MPNDSNHLCVAFSSGAGAERLVAFHRGRTDAIAPDRLGDFVRSLGDQYLVCHDVMRFHRAMLVALSGVGDTNAQKTYWECLRRSRIVDVQILDQLVSLAETGARDAPASIGEILARYAVNSSVSDSVGTDELNAIDAIFRSQARRAVEIADRHGVSPAIVNRFGNLGANVEVQHAIKALRGKHPSFAASRPRADDIARVMNSMGTIIDAMNPIRNNASMAHPKALLDEQEARLVINTARTILHYLDSKVP